MEIYREITDEELVNRHADMVYKICISHLISIDASAVDDAFQNTFLKYVKYSPKFKDFNSEKAWFIRCAINECINIYRERKRHSYIPLSKIENNLTYNIVSESDSDLLSKLWALPNKYKDVMHLYYIEEQSANEIAKTLKISVPSVCQRLKRGREKLRIQITNSEGRII
ncbi:MAG: hypothetical protein A2Y17_07775 [Clostridiales bacterium GWF2_38_85]|nr:MAG: hypothetical protein A2Y17_07775 [Clostridiales bacterium GWF2_38_85]